MSSDQQASTETYEHYFITHSGDLTFKMIEDEWGDIWWGYGHRESREFIEEVNRWLIAECGVTDPDDLFALNTRVEHLWARYDDLDRVGEHFTLVDHPDPEAGVFPVTRLVM